MSDFFYIFITGYFHDCVQWQYNDRLNYAVFELLYS